MAPKEQTESLKVDDDTTSSPGGGANKTTAAAVGSSLLAPSVLATNFVEGAAASASTIIMEQATASSSTIASSKSGNLSNTTTTSPSSSSSKEVKKLLRKIRDSKVAQEVEEAMTSVAMMINTDENEKSTVEAAVQTIVLLDGAGTVLMALKDWYPTSESISTVTIALLLKLSVLSDENIRMFVANVGLPTLVAAANAHKTNGSVICGVIGILSVLCEVKDEDVKEEIANDDCVDLCAHAMKTWQNETFVQSCCCLYLSNIASEPANKARLCEKGIGALILAALEKYRGNQEDKIVYRRAFRAMTLYIAE
ncbi:unnamed protein product [Cylindrotheca closterium]|uniref:Uncharacterized protein n=1 Tax=Cylindrotheca closterium TaxID=2856 RepID=A0AAD2JH55_9STRA|nr:unnamed protein product [Cylindrotheca closterium]